MGIAPQTFTGVSTYSNDLQTILTRAVNIASLPLKQLQNTESDLLQRKTQLSSFGDSVSALAGSFTSLASAVSTQGVQASTSDATLVSATASGATTAASYTINSITSLASTASETSVSGHADSATAQVSSTGSLQLVVGSKNYNINLNSAHNNLVGLRDAINLLGAGVSASILTTGTGANPNYLSITANNNGRTTLQLNDDPSGANTNLLTAANQGSDAVFQLNGVPVDRQSNTVSDVISGLSFTVKAKTTSAVTLTLGPSKAALSNALSTFASNYNALVDQINGQVGKSAGLLTGDFIVGQTRNVLREITGYTGSGAPSANTVQSLADLGISLDAQGKATFDPANLQSFSDAQLTSAFSFIGNSTSGFAALGAKLTQLSDPVTGLIKVQEDSYSRSDNNLKDQISALQNRINSIQTATQARLATVDTLLSRLQSQQSLLTASIQAANFSLFGKSTTQ